MVADLGLSFDGHVALGTVRPGNPAKARYPRNRTDMFSRFRLLVFCEFSVPTSFFEFKKMLLFKLAFFFFRSAVFPISGTIGRAKFLLIG